MKLVDSKIKKASDLCGISTRLPSGINRIDRLLKGGLALGEVSEWGMPRGRRGRQVIVQFIRQFPEPSLWVSNSENRIFPPSWSALGVNLKKTYFTECTEPVKELRPLFLEPLIKLIVIDRPQVLKDQDVAFLKQQVSKTGQTILVLRSYFLNAKRPNPLFRRRYNCSFDAHRATYTLRILRGQQF